MAEILDDDNFSPVRKTIMSLCLVFIVFYFGGAEFNDDDSVTLILIGLKLRNPEILIYLWYIIYIYFNYRFFQFLISGGIWRKLVSAFADTYKLDDHYLEVAKDKAELIVKEKELAKPEYNFQFDQIRRANSIRGSKVLFRLRIVETLKQTGVKTDDNLELLINTIEFKSLAFYRKWLRFMWKNTEGLKIIIPLLINLFVISIHMVRVVQWVINCYT